MLVQNGTGLVLPEVDCAYEPPGIWLKSRDSSSVGGGWALSFCISNKNMGYNLSSLTLENKIIRGLH